MALKHEAEEKIERITAIVFPNLTAQQRTAVIEKYQKIVSGTTSEKLDSDTIKKERMRLIKRLNLQVIEKKQNG